jgi:hypothetical protein
LERTDSDENFYLVKDATLTAGSAAHPRREFDHNLQEAVVLLFTPTHDKNQYVSKTIWYDPAGVEYRTNRQTHSKRQDEEQGLPSKKGGVTRLHVMPLKELWEHKAGVWKVELYIDDVLARRISFSVR